MQQPEGLWELGIGAEAGAGTPIIGYAPLGTLVTVGADGGTQPFGAVGTGPAANTFTLGITTDSVQNVYVGVGLAAANPMPATGIYKFAPAGGTGTLWSDGSAVTPPMNFPNGLDFVGSDLYVADSGGTIYKIAPSGAATVWSTDPLLAPAPSLPTLCGFPLLLGANGIVHDANNFYVANTDFGRLVKIPIQADGTAGTATALVDTCDFSGADGLAFDTTNDTILVAVNIKNRIERVSLTGVRTILASGPPLDAPASLFIESTSSGRRLLVTNASFFSSPDAATPGLLTLPLP
jgi:sugar lactone lactonase YvrE